MNTTDPAKLEERLERLPASQRLALARKLECDTEITELDAFVVPSSNHAGIDMSVRAQLAERLPGHMVPARISVVNELPRLPNGKVDTASLVEVDDSSPPSAAPPEALSSVEFTIAAIWKDLLDMSPASPEDDFFALGGHSFLVLRMVRAIQEKLGPDIAPAVVFRYPTVRSLASYITAVHQPSRELRHVFPLTSGKSERPFFFVQPENFKGLIDGALQGSRPLYGIRGLEPDPRGFDRRWQSLRNLAAEILEEIRHIQPEPPYAVGGYSFGALVAFELACLLEEGAAEVDRLVMFEPSPQVVYRFGLLPLTLWTGSTPLHELSYGRAMARWLWESHPLRILGYRKLARLINRDGPRWYRAWCARRMRATGREIPMKLLRAEASAERFRLYRHHQRMAFNGEATFFGSASSLASFAREWAPVLGGNCDRHLLPGDHLSFLEPENHGPLRSVLADVLAGAM